MTHAQPESLSIDQLWATFNELRMAHVGENSDGTPANIPAFRALLLEFHQAMLANGHVVTLDDVATVAKHR